MTAQNHDYDLIEASSKRAAEAVESSAFLAGHSGMHAHALNGMLKKLGCSLLVMALLASLNLHWALLQGLAWAKMLQKEQQQSTSFQEAVERTFSGDYPCDLCRLVEQNNGGKESPQQAKVLDNEVKIKLLPIELAGILILKRPGVRPHGFVQGSVAGLNFGPEPPPPRV